MGSVGDSYDNALAETIFGLYKTEVIRRPNSATTGSRRKADVIIQVEELV